MKQRSRKTGRDEDYPCLSFKLKGVCETVRA